MKFFQKLVLNCSKVVSAVLCLVLFCFTSMFFNASAYNFHVDADSIYYFMDYYPSIDYETLNNNYGANHNIIFDRQKLDEHKFYDLINNNYFTGFDENVTFILDIKTFCPDSGQLYTLFNNLKTDYDCNIVFITIYDSTDYVLDKLRIANKICFNADLWELNTFVKESFIDLDDNQQPYINTDYLIDGNMINVDDYYGTSLEELASHSPFLNAFLIELFNNFKNDFYDYASLDFNYDTILQIINDNHIRILVHTSQRNFMDIISWNETTNVTFSLIGINTTQQTRYLCSFVFLSFDSELYNFLYEIQSVEKYDIPVYGYIIDEIEFDPNGLIVKTNKWLLEVYGQFILVKYDVDGQTYYEEILERDYINPTKSELSEYLDAILM